MRRQKRHALLTRLNQKSLFELPHTYESANGVEGVFTDGKSTFRIDTHNLSSGEKFHIHIYDRHGEEIAVVEAAQTVEYFRDKHKKGELLPPSSLSRLLRTDIRRLLRNALRRIK